MIVHTSSFASLDTLVEHYRLQAKIEGKSPKTVAIYTTALTIFRNFLEQDGLSTDVTSVGVQELRRFVLFLQGARAYREHPFTRPQKQGLTGHTVNCYLRALRAFWGWLVSEEIIETNPFDKVKIPKPPKKVIVPFTEDQIKDLLAAIDTRPAIGFRDWTIILMFLDTGLRVTELINLEMENVNLNQRCFKVCGKGAKERIVPVGGTVQRVIAKYINRYRPEPVSQLSDYLFLTKAGEPLTANRIESIVETYGKKARIEGVRCSPHTFRHTFAITYLRNGGDVFSLQRILGHNTLDMVKHYVNLAQSDLQAAHLRCSPIDNMGLKKSSR
jgi:integrase/recombinase XerD